MEERLAVQYLHISRKTKKKATFPWQLTNREATLPSSGLSDSRRQGWLSLSHSGPVHWDTAAALYLEFMLIASSSYFLCVPAEAFISPDYG